MFEAFFKLGVRHITDFNGFDHMLFLAALCATYTLARWREVVILVTAFTVGHSITLALATFDVFRLPAAWVEFLIPLTIVLTCLLNLWTLPQLPQKRGTAALRYAGALCFGLIHGMGFSNYLRSLLLQSQSIFQPLLAFNLGLEAGQLLIVLCILIIGSIFVYWRSPRDWAALLTGSALAPALWMLIERIPS
jgi:predicted membrane protein